MPAGEASFSESLSDFASRLDRLHPSSRFALAVSGGRDSMALARLAAEYGRTRQAKIFAYSVDHGLRPEASVEAKKAVEWCLALGLNARVLKWTGDKPTTGLQEKARAARYRLLASAANEDQCTSILTAHSADDQAETVFMRLARGSGADGLAAMSETHSIAAGPGSPVRLLRPMLGFSRLQLTEIVSAADQEFTDDPSNDDQAFERVRIRALLGALAEQDLLTADALTKTAKRLGEAAAAQRREEEALFKAYGGCFYGWGGASLDRTADHPALGRLAARLVFAVSGEAHRPDGSAAKSALAAVRKTGTATLGGALLKKSGNRICFLREPGALLGRSGKPPMQPLPLEGRVLWDNRFILEASDPGPKGAVIAPMGPESEASRKFDHGPIEAVSVLPGIYQGDALIGAPGLPFMRLGGVRAHALSSERFAGGIIRF